MKNNLFIAALLTLGAFSLTSCEAIGDIFQAGMAIGIIIVVVVIIFVLWIIRKIRR